MSTPASDLVDTCWEKQVYSSQHGGVHIHRLCEKENPNTAASGVRGGGPRRAAAGGGGHGEAGQGEGNTNTLRNYLHTDTPTHRPETTGIHQCTCSFSQ